MEKMYMRIVHKSDRCSYGREGCKSKNIQIMNSVT